MFAVYNSFFSLFFFFKENLNSNSDGEGHLLFYSGRWGNCKLCSLCLCTGNTGHTSWCPQHHYQAWWRVPQNLNLICWCCVLTTLLSCSAALAHIILRERLHIFGILGCILCVVGSTTIVLHAPAEREIESVIEVWNLATEPGTLLPLIFALFICSCLEISLFNG